MAWFMLGGAYGQAGRHSDSARAYMRCVQINPGMSKAFQLAGQAFITAGDKDAAAEVLTQGYKSAAGRGDRMPMKAMGDLLTKLGRPVPEVAGAAKASAPAAVGGFVCQRTGRPGTKMPRPPFKGPVGEWIAANIAKETFDDWIAQGTKVINELRLDLSRDEDEAVYDSHMREYLGIDDALYEQLTGHAPVKP
jgi:Fe-S cluster biosynthesis and repair protein YggX